MSLRIFRGPLIQRGKRYDLLSGHEYLGLYDQDLDRNDLNVRIKASRKEIKVPSIVKGELMTEAYKKQNPEAAIRKIEGILSPFEIVPFDDAATEMYGKIRADLKLKEKKIEHNDLIIAVTVLSRGGVLVTKDMAKFECVEGLQIENWCK